MSESPADQQRHARALLPAWQPGDARPLQDRAMAELRTDSPLHDRWQLVRIRLGARWRPGLLTGWQQSGDGRWWIALVQ